MSKHLEFFYSQQLFEILIAFLAFTRDGKSVASAFQRCKKLRKILRTQKVSCVTPRPLELSFVTARGLSVNHLRSAGPEASELKRG